MFHEILHFTYLFHRTNTRARDYRIEDYYLAYDREKNTLLSPINGYGPFNAMTLKTVSQELPGMDKNWPAFNADSYVYFAL